LRTVSLAPHLGEVGSLVAAIGFAFSPKWMTHLLLAGHTVTIGWHGCRWCCWIGEGDPEGTSLARDRRRVAFALLVLRTHRRDLLCRCVRGRVDGAGGTNRAQSAALAAVRPWCCFDCSVLCAVQLLPTIEASRYWARTAGLESTQSLKVALATLFAPDRSVGDVRSARDLGVASAVRCVLAGRGVRRAVISARPLRWKSAVVLECSPSLSAARVFVEWLPDSTCSRSPPHALDATLPLAYLAGVGTDSLIASAGVRPKPADCAAPCSPSSSLRRYHAPARRAGATGESGPFLARVHRVTGPSSRSAC